MEKSKTIIHTLSGYLHFSQKSRGNNVILFDAFICMQIENAFVTFTCQPSHIIILSRSPPLFLSFISLPLYLHISSISLFLLCIREGLCISMNKVSSPLICSHKDYIKHMVCRKVQHQISKINRIMLDENHYYLFPVRTVQPGHLTTYS